MLCVKLRLVPLIGPKTGSRLGLQNTNSPLMPHVSCTVLHCLGPELDPGWASRPPTHLSCLVSTAPFSVDWCQKWILAGPTEIGSTSHASCQLHRVPLFGTTMDSGRAFRTLALGITKVSSTLSKNERFPQLPVKDCHLIAPVSGAQ